MGLGRVLAMWVTIGRRADLDVFDGLAKLALEVPSISLGAQNRHLVLLET